MHMSKTIWFTTKRYGWGWQPATWQGWIITLIFVILVALHSFSIIWYEQFQLLGMVAWGAVLGAIIISLLIICYIYGETPHWRWGNKD